ncbi:MAG TPA: hypothetical protein VEZ43_04840 [Dongiaceae bacterium]|jgi:hypothetical protein|nr:hypothetical protein [Dongiaceae bacterium]
MDEAKATIVKKSKAVREHELNEYFRRRCCNYEQFLCDRVWECAECARQSIKIEPIMELRPTVAETPKEEVKRTRWKS